MNNVTRSVGASGATVRRKVLIVDDHPIVRQGLRLMIDEEPDLRVCGEAQSEREARVAIRELEPDVVIVDISLAQGDGLELVRDVHAHHPQLPMLVLSMHDELIYAERLLARRRKLENRSTRERYRGVPFGPRGFLLEMSRASLPFAPQAAPSIQFLRHIQEH
jgi:CheY-like chemotaxis protein